MRLCTIFSRCAASAAFMLIGFVAFSPPSRAATLADGAAPIVEKAFWTENCWWIDTASGPREHCGRVWVDGAPYPYPYLPLPPPPPPPPPPLPFWW